jgi:cytochrome c oxidase cbb3-type subunit 2
MPAYGWLRDNRLDPQETASRMKANDFPFTDEEMVGLKDKNELDALIAYMQVIGIAVKKAPEPVSQAAVRETAPMPNPLAGDPAAVKAGAALFKEHCAACHGSDGKGGIGPSLVDAEFLYAAGDLPDDDYFEIINNGTQPGMVEDGRTAKGGMPPYANTFDKNKIWSLVSYIRSLQGHK